MKSHGTKSWVIVACVMALIFLPNYAQYQLSPLAYLIIPQFGLDAVQFSALFSAAMVFGALFSLVSGLLCDRYGTKYTIGLAGVISAIALIARVFAPDYASLYACMMFSGLVAAFLNSNVAKIMGAWFEPGRIGIAVGLSVGGATLGMSVAMGTSALFPSVTAAFAFAAAYAVVVVALWWAFFRERPQQGDMLQGGMSPGDAPAAGAGFAEDAGHAGDVAAPGFSACLRTVLRSRNVWLVGIVLAVDMASMTCIASFLPQVLQSVRGFDPASAGGMASAITFGNLAGAIVVPAINSRIGRLKPFTMLIAAVAAAGGAFAWQIPVDALMTAALFATGFCLGGIVSALMTVPVLLPEIGPTYAGTAGGMAATLQLLGGVVIPSYILTPLAGSNAYVLFGLAGVLCLVAVACIAALPEVMGRTGRDGRDVS